MNSCLITGHKGYIGSRLFSALSPLNPYGIDLKDGEDILEQLPDVSVDVVFHTAALPRVGYSVDHPSYTLKHNVLGTSRLLEWASTHAKRVVFSSSAAAKGDGLGPTSPYGLHKLMSEMECKLYAEIYGLDTVSLRYYNVYSEDQQFGGPYSTVLSAWMEMLRRKLPLRVDGDGEQIRDFVHVDDVVRANIFCAFYEESFDGRTLDIGTGEHLSLNEIRGLIDQMHDTRWTFADPRAGDIRTSRADIKPLTNLGWCAKIDIRKGIERCFNNANIR